MILKQRAAVLGALVSMLALAVALILFAPPASAAIYDETRPCQGSDSSSAWTGTCDNVWWNADPNARSARLYFSLISFAHDGSRFRNTGVGYAQSTDNSKKTYTYYCLYDNNTSSASLGTLTLGGGLPTAHDYRPQFGNAGWNPCQGDKGMDVVIRGWWGSSGHITSTIQVNSVDNPHASYAYECTYPSEIQYPANCT